jgi:glycosyltransferase involved in cell wall biosynthesis
MSTTDVPVAAVRRGGPFSKLRTAWLLARHGGAQGGWATHALQAVADRHHRYVPDLVWCTFGKMEAIFAARRIAARSRCPWVLDIKDNWELYVPRGLRRVMVWRTRGWSAVTANAQFTADKVRKWQRAQAEVVYSGVDEAFYEREPGEQETISNFRVNLIGSLYFHEHLLTFLGGLQAWVNGLPQSQSVTVELCYMGSDGAKFDALVQSGLHGIERRNLGYVDTRRMAAHCQGGAVNAYIGHSGTFHHKLLELLACGRPLLVVPGEGREEKALAQRSGSTLLEAADADQVAAALAQLHERWQTPAANGGGDVAAAREYSWPNQALRLNRVFEAVVRTTRSAR